MASLRASTLPLLLCLGCSDFEDPGFRVAPPADLPPVALVAIQEGNGTPDVNLRLDREVIEARIGRPYRERGSRAEYRHLDVEYSIRYSYLDMPLEISFTCDRFLVYGNPGTRKHVYYLCPRENIRAAYGQARLEGADWLYDSLGIGYTLDPRGRLAIVTVFKPTS